MNLEIFQNDFMKFNLITFDAMVKEEEDSFFYL